jgi:DNA helicase-2/ATP-dependent DNA helicase PcrA
MVMPDWMQDVVPGTTISGGETHPPRDTVRLNGPPGTGKTTEISKRVAYLIEEEDVNPSDVTLVTYRRSLADAVESRLREWGVLGEDIESDTDLEYWTTIHAAANRATGLLAKASQDRDGNSGFGPAVAEREKVAFCKGVLNVEYFTDEPWEESRGKLLMGLFGYMRNNLLDTLDPADVRKAPQYDQLVEEWPGVNVAEQWETYQSWKGKRDLYDFYELLEHAVDGSPPPSEVVVIDEYHDATPLMAQLSEKWVDAADTAIVAGDPKQVVNEFRGADPRFFTERLDHIPEILLDTTYRVPEEHWQAATRMLRQELDAPPVTRDGRGELVEYRSPPFAHSDENGWQAPGAHRPGSPGSVFEEYIEGESDRSVLYLTRTRMQASGVSAALDKAGVPHDGQDDVSGWTDRQFTVFNALHKLKSTPKTYGNAGATYGLDKYADSATDDVTVELSAKEAAAMLDHGSARYMNVSRDEAAEIAGDIREDGSPVSIDELDGHVKAEYWQKYCAGKSSVTSLVKAGELDEADVRALRNTLKRRDELVTEGNLRDVRVLTIHASKGSEATDVVVYDGVTNRIVSEMERSESARENEARAWYVALSRASERLHIMRDGFEWMVPNLPQNLCRTAAQAAANNGGVSSD